MKIYTEPLSENWASILARPAMESDSLNKQVQAILDTVKKDGDKALIQLSEKFDGVSLKNIQVEADEFTQAATQLSLELKKAIQIAFQNIKTFHQAQASPIRKIETMQGVSCWQKSVGIEKVGLYICLLYTSPSPRDS